MNLLSAIAVSFGTSISALLLLSKKSNDKYRALKIPDNCKNTRCDFFISIGNNFQLIKTKQNSLNYDRYYYCFLQTNGSYKCTEISLNSDLGYLSRIIYGEADGGNNKLDCKIAVGEVIRNRLKSNLFKGNSYREIIFAKKQFLAINTKKFRYQYEYIEIKDNESISDFKKRKDLERQDFLQCVQSALIVHFNNSNISENALFFDRSGIPPNNYKVTNLSTCKNKFYAEI